MVLYERNVDLEEIEVDTPFGISYLRHQTLKQKAILWGCIGLAMGEVFVFKSGIVPGVPSVLAYVIMLVLIAAGILFGTNYNRYLTMYQFAVSMIRGKEQKWEFRSAASEEELAKLLEKKRKGEMLP